MNLSQLKWQVCRTLEISRSSLYWKKKDRPMKRYKKAIDSKILDEIKIILKKRPTYGYKRVTAMINKQRQKQGEDRINKKRIYRIMDINGLILKSPKKIRDHKKTGKIITLHTNTRWCSDGFEIQCFNGEKVYVAFSLDCCDRECLSFIGKETPLVKEDIKGLMLSSVEYRFKKSSTDTRIQWLSDRGSIYRSPYTIQFAKRLGLISCFTAPNSPQSNGMAEAFVNTIKRDYVYISDCHDAKTVLKLLPKWIEYYNEEAPHSGLKMMSPREYIRSRRNLAEGCDQDGSIPSRHQHGSLVNKNND